ncbi:MAG: HAD family hydrolase [Candidatus Lokiarchaeota archaeon]|nr:HAD family hydrolase [Candidatus Lokiarchaeota archaeon]
MAFHIMNAPVVKIVVFDVDDTLWHGKDDPRATGRFQRIDDRLVSDGDGHAQELVLNALEVLEKLRAGGYRLALATMGPEDQVHAFMQAFGIDTFFDFGLSAFDREDKADKIERILRKAASDDPDVTPSQIVFVDDNQAYLAAVNARFPGVKCVWAHYAMEPGLLMFAEDMAEMHELRLW